MRCDIQESAMQLSWHIGDVIRKIREMRNIMQADLANNARMRQATLSRIENSGNYNTAGLRAIASALNMREADILALVPGADSVPAHIADSGPSLCSNQKHRTLQIMLDEILCSGTEWAGLISGNVISLHSSCFDKKPDLSLVVGGEPQQLRPRGRPRITIVDGPMK
jgi:transcriptional regulator with XRE-family HTH domain